jgi:hypothetical protein
LELVAKFGIRLNGGYHVDLSPGAYVFLVVVVVVVVVMDGDGEKLKRSHPSALPLVLSSFFVFSPLMAWPDPP